MDNTKLYVQFGCGLSSPSNWKNFDASPTLRLQKIPILGNLIKSRLNVVFPEGVLYGDIIKGLPGIKENSCQGVYCSHVLEHLSLCDFRISLSNTNRILMPGGIFRLVVPDLEFYINRYNLQKNAHAALDFLDETILGTKQRKRGIKGVMEMLFGNARHLWMWDYASLQMELEGAGFNNIRICKPGDSIDSRFNEVENPDRFNEAVGIECVK